MPSFRSRGNPWPTFEYFIVALLYKLYKYWKDAKDNGDNLSAPEHPMASSYMILRIGTFSLHLFIDLALNFIFIADPKSPAPDLLLGISKGATQHRPRC